jgi:hypothetical protein
LFFQIYLQNSTALQKDILPEVSIYLRVLSQKIKKFGNLMKLVISVSLQHSDHGHTGRGRGGSPPVCCANKASRAIFASQSGNIGLLYK